MSEQVNFNDVGNAVDGESNLETSEDISKEIIQSIIQAVIDSDTSPQQLSEAAETETSSNNHELNSSQIENQDSTDKTIEDDNTDQTNSNKSRELKSLLALSKEAKLDTNIIHKRKDGIKRKDSSRKSDSRRSHENRYMKFPVTAETELEQEMEQLEKPSVSKPETPKSLKRSRDSSSDPKTEGANEDSAKKCRKVFTQEMKVFKPHKDMFCWRCHREGVNIACETCPRSYHQKCLKQTITDIEHWPCPECVAILKAESTQTRSEALKGMTLEHLCSLLKFAVTRMIQCQGSEPFLHPVNDNEFPEYKKFIIQPMDLTKIEKNIKNNFYGSTQAFEADAKWLLHNSVIFNSSTSKLTYTAKNIIRICKQEMAEIENCPTCYLNANTKKSTWFVEVCPKPHLLVWAKLKGFPYWPAKVMSFNSSGMVDVRFFGAHDKAWVHYKECFLYSEKDPNTFKQKRYDIEKCIEELNLYVDNLKSIFGEFKYAPFRTFPDPNNELKQLQILIPKYKGIKTYSSAIKRRSIRENLDKINELKLHLKEESEKKQTSIEKESEKNDVDDVKENKSSISNEQQEKTDPSNQSPKKDSESKKDESFAFANSPEPRDESSMEGYGTDDDTRSEINLEKRRKLVHTKISTEDEEKIEDEDEDDTQVPNNISLEKSSSKGSSARSRASMHVTPGKIKVLPRKSDVDSSKSLSIEECLSPQKKTSRRNSDQSIKSDSSRLSNISDKINKVEFSEDMEITLGNDDGCVSISENISPVNGESSKSGSDSGIENKRKPVQVDIDNAEFTITPSNKLKIADQLIKRLSDSGSDQENGSANVNTKSVVEKSQNAQTSKSQTDMLIEKFKGIIEHKVVNFREPSLKQSQNDTTRADAESSNEESAASNIENVEKVTSPPRNESEPKEKTSDSSMDVPAENCHDKEDTANQVVKKQITNSKDVLKLTSSLEPTEGDAKKQKILIQPSIKGFTSKKKEINKKTAEKEFVKLKGDTIIVNGVPEHKDGKNSDVVNIVGDFEEEEEMATDDLAIDKNRIFNIIHSSLNKTAKTKENDFGKNDTEKKITQTSSVLTKHQSAEELMKRSTKQFHTYSKNRNKLKQTSQQKTDQAVTISNESEDAASTVMETEPNKTAETRKRKYSSDDSSNSRSKHYKLVSIEKIMNKDLKDKEAAAAVQKINDSTPNPPENPSTSTNLTEDIPPDEIKSEPTSDDDFEETENLEAKKQYLSALNISEKNFSDNQDRENEIRTRAKAEEKRERFRIVDNLTRVIDDVALNYSAQHEGQKLPSPRQMDRRKSCGNIPEGEIFVKSFAKLKELAQGGQQRARKSFPVPMYIKNSVKPISSHVAANKKELPPRINVVSSQASNSPSSTAILKVAVNTSTVATKTNITTSAVTFNVNNSTSTMSSNMQQKSVETPVSTLSHVILFPASNITYGSPIMNSVLGAVPTMSLASGAPQTTPQPQQSLLKNIPITPNVSASQNYIPQSAGRPFDSSVRTSAPMSNVNNSNILNNLLEQSSSQPREQDQSSALSDQNTNTDHANPPVNRTTVPINSSHPENTAISDDEFALLNSLIPENVSRAVSELLLRPPPRLKPRPPGMLSSVFDEGSPSCAGDVTTRINSIAHRMGDYFRGMLIETLEDLGKAPNPEAKIIVLQQELESVKHKHSLELAEIRKNICTILRDIQKSITEERERVVDETRAACEAETIKRIELAKSKQWCASCSKEAQFYCCWNTSYCDYPCQQKHWPQHMGKCTQNIEKSNNTSVTPSRAAGQPVILRPSGPPKTGLGPRVIAKPTKVYMNKATSQKTYKTLTSSGSHLTVIETTPGNYELVSNGSVVTGKIISTTSNIYNPKLKNGNVLSMSSPSSSGSGSTDSRISRPSISNIVSSSRSPAIGMPVQAILEEDP